MTTKKRCVMLYSDVRNRIKWEDTYYDKADFEEFKKFVNQF
jgi:hypothetical protein